MAAHMQPKPPSMAGAAGQPAEDEFACATEALRPDRSLRHTRLREAAALLGDNRPEGAEELLQRFLRTHPRDADAFHLMAEAATRQGRKTDAESLLARCVTLAPDFASARFNYANALLQVNKADAALEQLDELLSKQPRNPLFRRVKAKALDAAGNFEASVTCWRALTEDYPDRPECWVNYGHSLRSLGLSQQSVIAYRKAIEICPEHGAAYWSLANLKTFR